MILMIRQKNAVILIIVTVIFGSSFYPDRNNNMILESLENQSPINYQFIWETYNGSLGDLPGDDILIYGESFGQFHNYEEIIYKLQQLNESFSEIIDVFSIGKTYFGRDIYCVRITDENHYSKKTEMLVVAQHHAREQITVENALFFLDQIVYGFLAQDTHILEILKNKEIYIIPSLNIDGAKVIHRFPWQRKTARPIDEDGDGIGDEYNGTSHVFEASDKNGDGYIDAYFREVTQYLWIPVGHEGKDLDHDGKIGEDGIGGVDPNRNYDYDFGNPEFSTNNASGETYRGLYPFSENCTARLRDFIQKHDFRIAISLHSGAQEFYSPKYAINYPKNEEDPSLYLKIATDLSQITGFPHIYFHPMVSAGHWVNWMYWNGEEDTTLAFCFEVYGNPAALTEELNSTTQLYKARGIWDTFNPPANQVISNCELIYNALYYLAELSYFQELENQPAVTGYPIIILLVIIPVITSIKILFLKKMKKNSKKFLRY